MTLGDYISNFRRERGMSMDEFAALCHLSKGYISMLENNRNPRNNQPIAPSLETFQSVAKATGVELNELLGLLERGQPITLEKNDTSVAPMPDNDKIILSKRDTDPELLQIIDIFGKINGAGQHQLLLYANFLYTSDEYQPAQPIRRSIAAYGGGVTELPPLDPEDE